MSYGNYVQGSVDTTNNGYNLLISGAPSGYTQSGLMIGGDTATTYGVRVSKDATNNAYLDMRGDASNSLALRYKDNTSGTVTSMLSLSNDAALTGTGYGATINGRVNASAYYVGQADTRAPANAGVYMAMDGSNVGKFSINKGTGTGGFQFNTYNANGTLAQSNLNLLASGVVQAAYYTATGNAADSESVAIAGMDANGNLVRNYAVNSRYRAIESRMTALETDLTGNVPAKVNEIVNRLNGLNFFSQNIETLAEFAPATSPAPTVSTSNMYGEYVQFQFSSPQTMNSYSVKTAQGWAQSGYVPGLFALLGSNDGNTWTLLDAPSSIPQTAGNYSNTFTAGTYSYVRLVITKLNTVSDSYMIMCYIGLLNNGSPIFSSGSTSGSVFTSSTGVTATMTLSWTRIPSSNLINGAAGQGPSPQVLVNTTSQNTPLVGWSNPGGNYISSTLYPNHVASPTVSATTTYITPATPVLNNITSAFITVNPNVTNGTVAISSTGQYMSVANGTSIYTSSNYGSTWTTSVTDGSANMFQTSTNISMSADGKYQLACSYWLTYAYISFDFGATWSHTNSLSNCNMVAVSGNGQYALLGQQVGNGQLHLGRIANGAITWTNISSYLNAPQGVWNTAAISSTGQYMAVASLGDGMYISNNYGASGSWTFVPKSTTGGAIGGSVAVSSTGQYMNTCINNGSTYPVYVSSNYGVTWNAITTLPANSNPPNYTSCSVSGTGKYQLVSYNNASPSNCYISKDFGATFSPITSKTGVTWYYSAFSSNEQYLLSATSGGILVSTA